MYPWGFSLAKPHSMTRGMTGNIAPHGPQGHRDNLFFDGNWNVTAVSEHSGEGYVGDAGE